MANRILIKRNTNSGVNPSTSDLQVGELALNTADKKIFFKHSDGALHYVKSIYSSNLDELIDVNAANPTNNQALTWDTNTSKWIPKSVSDPITVLHLDANGNVVTTYNNVKSFSFDNKFILTDLGDNNTKVSLLQPTGFTGSQGSIGYTGSTGATGYVGSQGVTGYVGSQGNLGYTGSTGYTGSQGIVGYTGSSGLVEGLTSNDVDHITVDSGYNITPATDGQQNLGSQDKNFGTIHTQVIKVGGTQLSIDSIDGAIKITLPSGNLQLLKTEGIIFPDGTVQNTKAPKMYTNADAANGLSIDDLLPGDFYYDDGTESIFIMVDTGLGYNSLLDLTVRAPG